MNTAASLISLPCLARRSAQYQSRALASRISSYLRALSSSVPTRLHCEETTRSGGNLISSSTSSGAAVIAAASSRIRISSSSSQRADTAVDEMKASRGNSWRLGSDTDRWAATLDRV